MLWTCSHGYCRTLLFPKKSFGYLFILKHKLPTPEVNTIQVFLANEAAKPISSGRQGEQDLWKPIYRPSSTCPEGSDHFQFLTFVPMETEEMVTVLLAWLRPLVGRSPSDMVLSWPNADLEKKRECWLVARMLHVMFTVPESHSFGPALWGNVRHEVFNLLRGPRA